MNVDELRQLHFLKAGEAAEILRTDVRTVRRGIARGDLPAVRVNGTVRIPTDRFLAEVLLLPVEVTPDVHTDTADG